MRNSLITMAVLMCLFFTQRVNALGKDVVNMASGGSCQDAQQNLVDLIRNGDNSYSSDQAATGQFPTRTAFDRYCQDNGAAKGPDNFYQNSTKPKIGDSKMFPLPTYSRDVDSAPCSYYTFEGATTYYVGWKTSGSCNE